jgi:GNAT superfamily N-acetyltransferase
MPPVVRPMKDGDREAAVDLIWQLNLFENDITSDRRTERAAAEECLAINARRIQDAGGVQLVAEREGTVLGYLCAVMDEAPVYVVAAKRRRMWIADLVVAETARGGGLGRALIAAAEDFARGQGATRINIGAVAGNAGAQRLYESLGYAPSSVERAKELR